MKTQPAKQKHGFGWWLKVLTLLILAFALVTLGAGAYGRAGLMNRFPAPGRMLDVGSFKMHLYCTGQGSPTIILVSGLDDFSSMWSLVQPEVARTRRVCSYDRAGLGWSDPSPDQRTSQNGVQELHTLLANAREPGPYVLVGHSFGGALIRLYAHDYPGEVAGLVLVDSVHEDLFHRIPGWGKGIEQKIGLFRNLAPLSRLGILAFAPESIPNRGLPEEALAQYRAISAATSYYDTAIQENVAFEKNLAEVAAAHITSLGNLPLIVVSRGYWEAVPFLPEVGNKQAWGAWQEMQSELVRLSSNSRQIIAQKSEHFIQLQQPELVIAAIGEVVAANPTHQAESNFAAYERLHTSPRS